MWTDATFLNALQILDDWVELGVEPGNLVMDDDRSLPSNWQLGYPDDALQYFLCQYAADCPP